jgi:hypothetical protein
VLACVLLAVATPRASGEGVPSRPTAALVLRLSPAGFSGRAIEAQRQARGVRLQRVTPLESHPDWRERLESREERARAQATPDARYLYLLNATFLC